jgi:hypothetical protein
MRTNYAYYPIKELHILICKMHRSKTGESQAECGETTNQSGQIGGMTAQELVSQVDDYTMACGDHYQCLCSSLVASWAGIDLRWGLPLLLAFDMAADDAGCGQSSRTGDSTAGESTDKKAGANPAHLSGLAISLILSSGQFNY